MPFYICFSVIFEKTAVGKILDGSPFHRVLFRLLSNENLHSFVNGSGNNVILLFFRKFNEVYSISGNANRELRIFFRVRLCVQQRFTIENVYVQVITTICHVGIQHLNQIINFVRHNKFSF